MAQNNPPQGPKNPDPQLAGANEETEPAGPFLPAILAEGQKDLESRVADLQFKPFDDRLEVRFSPDKLLAVAAAAKDLGYRILMSITGVDYKDRFEVVYHLYRLDSAYPIVLRYDLPHEDNPEVQSLMPIWPGAEFQEREIYDLLGIVFVGHPDLRRILLADDFQGHPLRKDFQQNPDYVLVPHLRIPGYRGAQATPASTGRFSPDEVAQ